MKFIRGEDLKAMRLLAGFTTRAMAEVAGVKTRKTYENWEKELGCPNINQFLLLTRACSLDCADTIAFFMHKSEGDLNLGLLDLIKLKN